MLTLLDNAGTYQLPTGWHEVTTRQYCDLDQLQLRTVEARASYFAGRPIQVNELVADVLAFLVPLTDGSNLPTSGGLPYPADLGQETFLQVETIRALLATSPLCACYGEVYGTFVARHTLKGQLRGAIFHQAEAGEIGEMAYAWKMTATFPAVAHCLAELQRLNEAFAALAEPDETEAGRKARAAGSERLAVFSHLNVARHYAERFGTTIDAVYQWPWQQVALFMLQDKISAEIQDNLQKQSTSSHD